MSENGWAAVFERAPLSWNEVLAAGARKRMRLRREEGVAWAAELLAQNNRPATYEVPVSLSFAVASPRPRDPDNLYVKPIIDAMRKVGILVDDGPLFVAWVRLAVLPDRSPVALTYVEISTDT